MKLYDVSVDKRCPDGCGCLNIDGGPSPSSVMWTHENVDVDVGCREFERVVMRGGELHEADPEDEYVDLLLPCGTLVGYVDVEELRDPWERLKVEVGRAAGCNWMLRQIKRFLEFIKVRKGG